MAIHAERNLYPGVNAHLNSFLQQDDGGWESFHAMHINDIRGSLDVVLPENYYAVSEKSLQVSEVRLEAVITQRPCPDVTVVQTHPSSASRAASAAIPTAVLPLSDTLPDDDDYFTSVVIYEVEAGRLPGKPVTRIELLSPGNKSGGRYYHQYVARRRQTLKSGLSLVEIDYLHQSPPILPALASYIAGEPDFYPYMILVSDPHPVPAKGHVSFYGVQVVAALPLVSIPLADIEQVTLDLQAVYNQTMENARVFRLVVDYEQDPLDIDRYTGDDRKQIRALLAGIRQAPTSAE